jgi:ubiquinone/menaquinone biosynthesis C-methylase UbiE
VKKGHQVLDLGCGTATLTLLIKQAHPEAQVAGLDGDPKALEIARGKVARSGLTIPLDEGMAFNLPIRTTRLTVCFPVCSSIT